MAGPVQRLLALFVAPCAATACTLGYEIDERVRDRTARDQGALVQSIRVEAVETRGEDLVLHVRELVHQRVLEKTYLARDVDLEVREGITGRPEDLIQNPVLALALSPLVAVDLATFTVSSAFTLPKAFFASFDPWRPLRDEHVEERVRPARKVRYRVELGAGLGSVNEKTSREGLLRVELAEQAADLLARGYAELPITIVDRRLGLRASAEVTTTELVRLARHHVEDEYEDDPALGWREILLAIPASGSELRRAVRDEIARSGIALVRDGAEALDRLAQDRTAASEAFWDLERMRHSVRDEMGDLVGRPHFALEVRTVDDGSGASRGNGDGALQPGESMDLILAVENTGGRRARYATLALEIPDLPGLSVRGEREIRLGDLEPGEIRESVVTVAVSEHFEESRVPVLATVSERSRHRVQLHEDLTLRLDGAISFPRIAALAPVSMPPPPARVGGRAAPNAAPIVAFLSPAEGAPSHTGESELRVQAVIKDDAGIRDWSLLVNGEPVATRRGSRGIRPKGGAVVMDRTVNVRETVALRPGPNRLRIEARDASGGLGAAEASIVRSARAPRVVALVVGIDAYDDPGIARLRYAEADARAFAAFLRSDRSPVRDPDDVVLLTGRQATAREIRTQLDRHLVRKAVHPEDMALLYFAGHGFSMGSKTFLTGVDTEQRNLRATGLRATELREFLDDIGAGRKVLIADACHSGGLPGLRGANAVNAGLAGDLASPGTVSFLASSQSQLSVESPELGHGVFTYALLRGLEGEADRRGNRDGRVSAKELATYLDGEVPALARRQGHAQHPMFNGTTGGSLVLSHPQLRAASR